MQHKKERLKISIPKARAVLSECRLCPRRCRVDRTRGQKGSCRTGSRAVVHGVMPHFGEEFPLSGTHGSGTIFFSHCPLKCCFCQNYAISILGEGAPVSPEAIARAILLLQDKGCHNINLVTPTHVVPFILEALDSAIDQGFFLPLIYNSSGYETLEILSLLDGIVDIYLPDFKFWNPDLARAACNAPDYPEVARTAVKMMYDQVGNLETDERGIAKRGLLVRHLVMPETSRCVESLLRFLTESISPAIRINLMSQYRPLWEADRVPAFGNPVSAAEFRHAVNLAKQLGVCLID